MSQSPTTTSSSESPTPRRPRTSRRGLKVAAILIASIPTAVVVLAFPVSNLVVEASWENFRTEWEAKGEIFELEDLLGPAIPDEENFAKAPIIAEHYDAPAALREAPHDHDHDHDHDHSAHAHADAAAPGPSRLSRFSVYADGSAILPAAPEGLAFLRGQPVNLAANVPARAGTDSPVDYLRGIFTPHEPVIAELMEAAKRPGARYPVDRVRPSATQLAHLPALIPAIHSLRLHNLALIESGPEFADLAAERLIGTLRVIRLGTDTVGLASHSVRTMALESAGLEVAWHALYRQRFDEAQWAAIDRELRAFDFGPRLLHSLRFERSAMVRELEYAFRRGSARPFSVPPAWVQLSGLIEYAELTQRYWFTDSAGGRLLTREPRVDQFAVVESLAGDLEGSPENMVVALGILPVYDFAIRAAAIESQHDHALLAIAIERHRLAHGAPPESLSQLVPEWIDELPVNVLTGQVPRYDLQPGADEGAPAAAYRLRTFGDNPVAEDPVWLMPLLAP